MLASASAADQRLRNNGSSSSMSSDKAEVGHAGSRFDIGREPPLPGRERSIDVLVNAKDVRIQAARAEELRPDQHAVILDEIARLAEQRPPQSDGDPRLRGRGLPPEPGRRPPRTRSACRRPCGSSAVARRPPAGTAARRCPPRSRPRTRRSASSQPSSTWTSLSMKTTYSVSIASTTRRRASCGHSGSSMRTTSSSPRERDARGLRAANPATGRPDR